MKHILYFSPHYITSGSLAGVSQPLPPSLIKHWLLAARSAFFLHGGLQSQTSFRFETGATFCFKAAPIKWNYERNKCFDEKQWKMRRKGNYMVFNLWPGAAVKKHLCLLLHSIQVTHVHDIFNSLSFCNSTDAVFRGVISLAPVVIYAKKR